MRSSSIALTVVVGLAGLLVALPGCSLECSGNQCTAKTVPEFVDSGQPAKTSTDDTNLDNEISITNNGVNPLTGTGGIQVNFDASATKITAKATFAGRADTEAEAQQSIKDAIATFQVTGNSVVCRNGNAHGSSTQAGSGCKLLQVTIPAGTDQKPLRLKIGGGNGDITFTGAVPTVIALTVDNNALGDVNVKAKPVKDATIVVTGENKVNVGVPADFSAQSVVLTVNSSTSEETKARIITAFDGMESNKPYPVAGATQNAAKTLNVQSKGLLDDYTVTISKL